MAREEDDASLHPVSQIIALRCGSVVRIYRGGDGGCTRILEGDRPASNASNS